jgi:hypothetical protein
MMRRAYRTSVIARIVAVALALSACGAPRTAIAAPEGAPANLGILSIAAERWPAVDDLVSNRSGFDPPYGGGFDAVGFGVRVQYLHRMGAAGGVNTYLGGEFAGYANEGGDRYAGTVAGTGQPVEASLFMNSGYFALCGRISSGGATARLVYLSMGVGAYLVVAKDEIMGMYIDSSTRDESLGGYLGLGLGQPFASGKFRLELESRVHAFDFRDLSPGFPAQHAGGPMFEVAMNLAMEL